MKFTILINLIIGLAYANSDWMMMTSKMPFNKNKYCSQWNAFVSLFNKTYSSAEEEQKRFTIFKNNLIFVTQFNKGNYTYRLGINEFIDLVCLFIYKNCLICNPLLDY
jgi:hypothetical protein